MLTVLQTIGHAEQEWYWKDQLKSSWSVRRENNTRADALSRLATTKQKGIHRSVVHVTLCKPSVSTEECMTTDTQPNWMTPIKQYLTNGICDPHFEKTMKQHVARFVLIDQDLYR